MTPKEKAEELIDKFMTIQNIWYLTHLPDGLRLHQSKESALIAVKECLGTCVESMIYYWNEVKQEIEKL
jgi:hypothetical protein